MKPLLCTLLIVLLLATPVAATVQYPEEYYNLNKESETTWAPLSSWTTYSYTAIKAVYLKLQANQIALERQNELLQEQNELLKQLVPAKQDRIEIDPSAFNGTWYYCNALNASQCWKNASEIPRYLP